MPEKAEHSVFNNEKAKLNIFTRATKQTKEDCHHRLPGLTRMMSTTHDTKMGRRWLHARGFVVRNL
jgi:hypothetical protein